MPSHAVERCRDDGRVDLGDRGYSAGLSRDRKQPMTIKLSRFSLARSCSEFNAIEDSMRFPQHPQRDRGVGAELTAGADWVSDAS
jgi:hypothetical protein